MTVWEKQWMESAPQDCLRTFRMNPNAPGGWSEYGETLLDLETTESLNDDSGRMLLSLLKVDAVSPLPTGTFIRMYLFGSISNGVPVWEFEENGEPKNFRNYYIMDGNSRWFERHPTGHVDRYRHDYNCAEVMECLKDYPIRSVKTFAEGAYTFGECLDIAFKLAFRPRSVGNYRYVIKPFPGLEEPNSKLEYPNSTLYDVVTDIGRIIDAVPHMELTFEDGVYTFELKFIDRYGLEGKVHDISYFNDKIHDGSNFERSSCLGKCISNVQNLLTGSANRVPAANGRIPAETNPEQSMSYFELPYAIDTVEEVDIYWRYDVSVEKGLQYMYDLTLYTGEKMRGGVLTFGDSIIFVDPLKITYNGYSDFLYSKKDTNDKYKKTLYLREYEEYRYLLDIDSNTMATKKNTIYYKRGDNKIFLDALFNNTYRYWYELTEHATETTSSEFMSFSNKPDRFKFYVAVKVSHMFNGVIKGINSKQSDITGFFNQQAQVVDIKSFGTAVTNYTKSMYGESRVRVHTYDRIGRREMYAQMPKVGSSVIDKERGKRYVVTTTSFTRRMNGGELLATLTESRAGKSRYIIADNEQRCYAIPNENVVDSMSHTHIICKMGVQSPFPGASNNSVIEKPYLFNALIGTPHGTETHPSEVNLNISTKDGNISTTVDIYRSQMRLSALLAFRMLNNSTIRIENGNVIKYTDEKAQLQSITFKYMAGQNKAIEFSQELDKDSYEILNHTTQTSWVEYGNLRIHENFINMSYFGNGEGLNEPLQLVLLSSRMRLKEPLAEHTVARYDVAYADSGSEHIFTANGLTNIPAHVGWAIARGDKLLLLDNFDVLSDNVIKIYYQVELQD